MEHQVLGRPQGDVLRSLGLNLSKSSVSTGSTIQTWFQDYARDNDGSTEDECSQAILSLLLRVVASDSLELQSRLRDELHKIHGGMNESDTIQARLQDWQKLLVQYRELEQSLSMWFDRFLTTNERIRPLDPNEGSTSLRYTAGGSQRSRLTRVGSIRTELSSIYYDLAIEGLRKDTETMMADIYQTSAALASTMSIIESKRAIAEASAVTKLTELAFFFIPLSFSVGLFSMQVQVSQSAFRRERSTC